MFGPMSDGLFSIGVPQISAENPIKAVRIRDLVWRFCIRPGTTVTRCVPSRERCYYRLMFETKLITILSIVFRTLVIYVVVVFGLRIFGKREIGQMTIVDLALLLLLANTVQNAMTGPDTTLTGGITAALTLLVANLVVTKLAIANRRLGKIVRGSATMLVWRGHVVHGNLAAEGVTIDELHEALREHGVADIGEVAMAVLEIDGAISVIRDSDMPESKRTHRLRYLKKS